MPKPLKIPLTDEQRRELEEACAHHEKPYMRERASAILNIANGMPGRQVALNGLLKCRHPDTVYTWVRRWKAEGLPGLAIRPGRGRKPRYPTCPTSPANRRQEESVSAAVGSILACSHPKMSRFLCALANLDMLFRRLCRPICPM